MSLYALVNKKTLSLCVFVFNIKKQTIMKKTYMNPTCEVVKIAGLQLLTGSNPEDGFSKSGVGTTSETSGNMARDYDFDFDED